VCEEQSLHARGKDHAKHFLRLRGLEWLRERDHG
jgi:hypothetical protein